MAMLVATTTVPLKVLGGNYSTNANTDNERSQNWTPS